MKARRFVAASLILALLFGLVRLGGLLRQAEREFTAVAGKLRKSAQTTVLYVENEDGTLLERRRQSPVYEPITLAEIDPRFLADVVAVEDSAFFAHAGVRWDAIMGAALRYSYRGLLRCADFLIGSGFARDFQVRGGSTITQQLIKNLLRNPPRTVPTKIKEIYTALRLERRLRSQMPTAAAKRFLLERYLNEIYAAPEQRGIRNAAQLYLGKAKIAQLDARERAVLIAAIQAPAALMEGGPRAQRLLRITAIRLRAAERKAPRLGKPAALHAQAQNIKRNFQAQHPAGGESKINSYSNALFSFEKSLRYATRTVRTCRNPTLDTELGLAFRQEMAQRDREAGQTCSRVGAYILVRLTDGAVVAAGDSDCTATAELVEARRQVLSTFKPFLYARALQELQLTPASIVNDHRVVLKDRLGRPYAPGNHYPIFKGDITLKTALQFSSNTVSLQLLQQMSAHSVIGVAQSLFRSHPSSRLRDRFNADFALALGAVEMSPAELATGYLSLLTGGRKRYLRLRCDQAPRPAGLPLLAEVPAAQIREMLTSVVKWEGTAGFTPGKNPALIIKELGGKSGSSERDSWFAGFSQDLLLVTWVGVRAGQPEQPANLNAAALWRVLFARTTKVFPPRPLLYPSTLTRRYFCKRTGLRPGRLCRLESGLFAAGQAPQTDCTRTKRH